jgi:hypothetical protein
MTKPNPNARRKVPSHWSVAQRLAFYSNPPLPNGCVEWNAAIDDHGYGQLGTTAGGMKRVSRLTLEIKLGRPLRKGKMALHTCDNRKCLAPDHLYEGTRHDNAHDRDKRTGYDTNVRGVDQHLAVLDEAKVRLIRASNASASALARQLGVNVSTVCNVRRWRTWRHIKP